MSEASARARDGLAWQVGVWNRMSDRYLREIDRRFAPVVERVVLRAALGRGDRVLDVGTGTGSVAILAAHQVTPGGSVLGLDPSPEMLALARPRGGRFRSQLDFGVGRAEAMPCGDATFDVVLASLSLMYVIDRGAAAREIARVLRPGGRFVAAVWAGPDRCDIVRFQEAAARFAPAPPVPGVGPGALARAAPFLGQLAAAGIETRAETETLGFDFDSFEAAWDVLAGVTAAALTPERLEEARAAVRTEMWPSGDGPRHFTNVTQFLVGRRR